MAAASSEAISWAVLIGVDYYGGADNLKGSTPLDVATLTATAPPDPTSRRPVEDPDRWPTWPNVTTKLKRVLNNAKSGDLVYLHYAGHGTRLPESAESCHSASNLAFALFEETGPGMRHFHCQLLASCLRRMVEREPLVTDVLGCYFSGSLLRDVNIRGTDVRALSYFLIDALGDLRKRGTDITYESLYKHLRVTFYASWP